MSASPDPGGWPVRFHGGARATAEAGVAQIEGGALVLLRAGEAPLRWSLGRARILAKPEGSAPGIVAPDGDGPARILFAQPGFAVALRAAQPRRAHLAWLARPAVRRTMLWAGGALASVLFVLFVAIPLAADSLAAMVPADYERRFGAQIAEVFAKSLAGKAAPFCATWDTDPIQVMARRIESSVRLPHPLVVRVVDSPVVNAFAAPGGQILVMRGLVELTATPEEMFGVLAHEAAHVEHKDAARGMVRSVATGAVLGLVFGDAVFFSAAAAAATLYFGIHYTHDAEAAADATAFRTMAGNGVAPRALGDFLIRLEQHGNGAIAGLAAHLATHPPASERAKAAAAALPERNDISLGIPRVHWLALKTRC